MKVLKSWLEDYVDIKYTDDQLIEELTFSGTLVDDVYNIIDENIIVGKIVEIKKHPNADKLQIAMVDNGKQILQIVCGAPNIEAGQKVPLAQIGAKIDDFAIKQANLRGIDSFGMLCSGKELGISDDHSGILILDEKLEIGKPLSSQINTDLILDLEITPNRGDCLSHIGIAREIAAFSNEKLKNQKQNINLPKEKSPLKVENTNLSLCPQYSALYIKNVKIDQSPAWIQKRLIACGLKPINNIVDITNYILLDLGQPMHAFDADKLASKKIIIRKAQKNEKIKALDGSTHTLNENNLLITDKNGPIAIAGVIGGLDSSVTSSTRNIILESAQFNSVSIRKTSKTLNISTDASYRYERQIDPEGIKPAMLKAAQMITELAGGEIIGDIVYVGQVEKNQEVAIEHHKINNYLGLNLSNSEIDNILTRLQFEVKDKKTIAPSWRHDINIWQDLSEEVSRIYGFKNVPKFNLPKTDKLVRGQYYTKEYIKDIIIENGFTETINYPFMSEVDLETAKLDKKDLLKVANPIQPENKFMRKSLIPGLLKSIAKNPSFDQIAIFEIGNVFTKEEEHANLSIATSGKNARKLITDVVEQLNHTFKIDPKQIQELSRKELTQYKIKKPVTHIIEINLSNELAKIKIPQDQLDLKIEDKQISYRQISKYPSINRDLAIIVDKNLKSDKITETIPSIKLPEEIANVEILTELFDEFVSDKFGQDKKSLAYHIFYQAADRTLKDEEAEVIHQTIIQKLQSEFDAKPRI